MQQFNPITKWIVKWKSDEEERKQNQKKKIVAKVEKSAFYKFSAKSKCEIKFWENEAKQIK